MISKGVIVSDAFCEKLKDGPCMGFFQDLRSRTNINKIKIYVELYRKKIFFIAGLLKLARGEVLTLIRSLYSLLVTQKQPTASGGE